MYLLKHICIGVNSVIDLLIVALVPTTSACLSSFTPGTSITANYGLLNAGLTYFKIDNNKRHLALLYGCIPNGGSAGNV
ncbi:hypothetical protein SAMN05660816_00185 [Niastella yeongjuensis]|nr:hypothetical protein SAMN05660816_00185 [Niastella yeongjuensis]